MLPDVVSYPEEQRIWLVRASGGKHFQNFLKHDVVAISHIDKLIGLSASKEIPAPEAISEFLYAEAKLMVTLAAEHVVAWRRDEDSISGEHWDEDGHEDPENKMSAANRESQVSKFINDFKIGDLIVTINSTHIAIGYCVSDVYVDETVLVNRIYRDRKEPKIELLEYKLRRNVSWGDPIPRDLVSLSLRKPLLARNTVSSLDEHWDKVYTLAYPIFVRDGMVYFSNRINRQGPIGTRSMCVVLDSIVCAQLVADAIFTGLDPDVALSDLLSSDCYDSDFEERLMSQAEVMSPGYLHHKIRCLAGVSSERYAAMLMLLMSIGLSGCEADTQNLKVRAANLISSFQQDDMSKERSAVVVGALESDEMLQDFQTIMKNKGVAKVASNLRMAPGNAVGALPPKKPAVKSKAGGGRVSPPSAPESVSAQAVQFKLNLE